MVSRTATDPQSRPNKFTDVGVVGRKTGLMIKDTGRRDSAGLEDMDAFFSPAADKALKKSGLSPHKLSAKTKFQTTIESDESVPMSGTSSSIRDPVEVLASRKSLLAQHRTPQKTFLKSPAVRVQTPKQGKLDPPSRVKQILSFTEIDADFEDGNLYIGRDQADQLESPTELAKPAKRKGLVQQARRKQDEFVEEEPENEDIDEFREENNDDYGGFGGGFEDDLYDQGEVMEEALDALSDDSEDIEQEEEPDAELNGQRSSPRLRKTSHRASRNATRKPLARTKGRPLSARPSTKRAPTKSPAPKIIERREVPQAVDTLSLDSEVRRSKRIRVAPLAHWRNERIVYELEGRRESGPALPKIKEIVRIDTPPQPARNARPIVRKRKAHADSDSEDESDGGEVYATVKSYADNSTIDDYKLAVSKSAINPRPLQGSQVQYEKLFQDGEYTACGIMDILVGGVKGVKSTKHSYMNFVVLKGKVEVKVHKTAFVIGKGGVFVVPRGNYYSIKNAGENICRLFFSQAVEAAPQPEEHNVQDE